MEKLKETLERLFWKRNYISELEDRIIGLMAENGELEKKLRETERLNRGLASDLTYYKNKSKKAKKGGKE